MNQKLVSIAIAAMMFIGINCIQAQENAASEPIDNMSKGEYYKTHHKRKPIIDVNIPLTPQAKSIETKSTKAVTMPEKFWFPGEFEEVQAILITWPYIHTNKSGFYAAYPITDSLAYWFVGNQFRTGEYISRIDTASDTRLPIIFAKIASAIQKGNAEVWINICNAGDSLILKNYMRTKGYSLENYRFFVNPQNSFWYRDCGPVGFYQGDNDKLSFLDFEYYGDRPLDDLIPIRIGQKMNIPVYTTSFEFEGGNLLLDGAGTLFTSDHIYKANEDDRGLHFLQNGQVYYTTKVPLTKTQIHDTLNHLLGLDRLEILPALKYDGGTGHIDLYAAMWDENNFVFTKYPEAMSSFVDYTIASKNIDSVLSLHSIHQENYKGRNIPLPKRDNDTWYTSDTNYAIYTRTYSNSTFVNNVIIQPIFSDTSWGAREWDLKAIALMQKQFPGYEIIPIDIRGYQNDWNLNTGFDGTGGAIHCVTKQIPAENPIRILHKSIQGLANDFQGEFPIKATITNNSGIASATCYWRAKGTETWNTLALEAEINNEFSAILNREAETGIDTVEYYISATSNNGKTITKPFTAPKGYYSFYYGDDAVVEEIDIYTIMETITPVPNVPEGTDFEPQTPIRIVNATDETIGDFYPNPAKESTQILISGMNQKKMQVSVVNTLGQIVYANTFTPYDNQIIFQLKVSSFQSGMYTVIFSDNTGKSVVKKLIVQ